MQNGSWWFCGSTRPSPISCSKEIPNSSRSGPRCSSISAAVEAVVAGRHGRVGGEDGVLRHVAQRIVKRHSVVLHPLADRLERGKRAVPLVQMIHAGRDAQRLQGPDAPHAGDQLLADSRPVVAAVEPRGQLAVLGAVALHVAVQQIEADAAHPHQPDLGQQLAGAGLDLDGDRLAVRPAGGLHRQVLDLRVQVLLLLPAVAVQVLLEVALVVEQPDGHQGNPQAAGALDVVAREHAQTAGVDRHRLVDPELQREVGHRLRAQHAGVGLAPKRRLGDVLLQTPIGVVDAAEEDQLGCPHLEPLGRELREQGDRVVVQLPPADRVEVAEEIDHLRVPTPPEVSGQGHALVIQRLRRKPNHPRRLWNPTGNRFNLSHANCRLLGLWNSWKASDYSPAADARRPQKGRGGA